MGALALHRGVLWVGWHERTAHVAAFDLDGRALGPAFAFRDERLGRSSVRGLAVDDDHNLWIADEPCSRVRRFSVFGRELGGLGLGLDVALESEPEAEPRDDAPGRVRRPVAVLAHGDADGLELWIGSGGTRRHALQRFDGEGRLLETLRPLGDPHGRYRGLSGLARLGRWLAVAEAEAGRIQIFRDGEFHFAFTPLGAGFRPQAVAWLDEARLLIAGSGRDASSPGGVYLCDGAGRVCATLAPGGPGEAQVEEPSAIVVEPGVTLERARVAVLDRGGERVQLFRAQGRFFGAFAPSAPPAGPPGEGVERVERRVERDA